MYRVEDEDERCQKRSSILGCQQSTIMPIREKKKRLVSAVLLAIQNITTPHGVMYVMGRKHAHEYDLVLRKVHVGLPQPSDKLLICGDSIRKRLGEHTGCSNSCDGRMSVSSFQQRVWKIGKRDVHWASSMADQDV